MVSISDIENGWYYWETENSHANNTVSANDFIENELPPNVDVYFQDENYLEFLKVVSIILQPYSVMVILLIIKLILNL